LSRQIPFKHRLASGFTLVETLVVLVLVSLIATLLTQSLVYVFSLRTRVLEQVDSTRQAALSERWYRQSVNGTVADLAELEREFVGTADGFSAVTLAPVHLDYGVPTRIRWELVSDEDRHALTYEAEDAEGFTVLSWQGAPGGFRYLGHDGEWHDQWPPRFGVETRQLPAAVLFQGWRRGEPRQWLTSIPARKNPRLGLRLPKEFL
jgi:prepilin-type N-terminal cleavage/methylation domain-containing protein